MSELVLIGIVALIIFGPRKLPQLARKAGKTMNDLRKVTGEFKETWEKEVDLSELEEVQTEKTVSRPTTFNATESTDVI
jgi:Tat protein translocase TatB subunit